MIKFFGIVMLLSVQMNISLASVNYYNYQHYNQISNDTCSCNQIREFLVKKSLKDNIHNWTKKYDQNKRLIEFVEYDRNNELTSTLYLYNNSGKLILEIVSYSQPKRIDSIFYVYDEHNSLKKIITQGSITYSIELEYIGSVLAKESIYLESSNILTYRYTVFEDASFIRRITVVSSILTSTNFDTTDVEIINKVEKSKLLIRYKSNEMIFSQGIFFEDSTMFIPKYEELDHYRNGNHINNIIRSYSYHQDSAQLIKIEVHEGRRKSYNLIYEYS